MKRYLLFVGDEYYPRGGWSDFVGSFDTVAEALGACCAQPMGWHHIVDSQTGALEVSN